MSTNSSNGDFVTKAFFAQFLCTEDSGSNYKSGSEKTEPAAPPTKRPKKPAPSLTTPKTETMSKSSNGSTRSGNDGNGVVHIRHDVTTTNNSIGQKAQQAAVVSVGQGVRKRKADGRFAVSSFGALVAEQPPPHTLLLGR